MFCTVYNFKDFQELILLEAATALTTTLVSLGQNPLIPESEIIITIIIIIIITTTTIIQTIVIFMMLKTKTRICFVSSLEKC